MGLCSIFFVYSVFTHSSRKFQIICDKSIAPRVVNLFIFEYSLKLVCFRSGLASTVAPIECVIKFCVWWNPFWFFLDFANKIPLINVYVSKLKKITTTTVIRVGDIVYLCAPTQS